MTLREVILSLDQWYARNITAKRTERQTVIEPVVNEADSRAILGAFMSLDGGGIHGNVD